MALVAFDLDNTLGYFDAVAPWGDVWSLETLENCFNLSVNPKFHVTPELRRKLKAAEAKFLDILVKDYPELVKLFLRPNLDAMIEPLVAAKRAGKVRAVCIYSNTWSTYCVHFGKALIERVYDCPGFFDCVIDCSHPLRKVEYKKNTAGEGCEKTLKGLKSVFRRMCGVKGKIRPADILFVDERFEKHRLQENEKDGLVYLKPTFYGPFIRAGLKKHIFQAGIQALQKEGLLGAPEFEYSDVTYCVKFGAHRTFLPIQGSGQLLSYVEQGIETAGWGEDVKNFKRDSREIRKTIGGFLERF